MQKILVAMLMALVLTLALVGVKSLAQGDHKAGQPKTVMADGGAPAPPIPW